MDITFDANFLYSAIRHPYFPLVFWFLVLLVIFYLIYFFARTIWRKQIKKARKRFMAAQEYTVLAIDVPKNNYHGPESVERMFAHLAGIESDFDWKEKYFEGNSQLSISLELISVHGQIQYLIRTPIHYRDIVEAAVYSSYPDSEIMEVEDYTESIPDSFPDDQYDIWGSDLVLYKDSVYPIRTYPSFEHGFTKEFKDPMVDLWEVQGLLQEGENIWFQIIIKPIGNKLENPGRDEIKKLLGDKISVHKNKMEKILDFFVKIIVDIGDAIFNPPEEKDKKEEKKVIGPAEKKVTEAIHQKFSKIHFETTLRVIYLAKKDVFNKIKGSVGILGALNAINTLDMNGFKSSSKSKTFKKPSEKSSALEARQTAIIQAYKSRASSWGVALGYHQWIKKFKDTFEIKGKKGKENILNIEELATLYHFPVVDTKVPLIKKATSKKGEPPVGLPIQ